MENENKYEVVGKNEKADDSVNNDIANIGDDLEEDTLGEMLRMLEGQAENFERNIQRNTELKKRFMELWEYDKEIYQITLANFRPLEKRFEFENSERYWELQTIKQRIKFEAEENQTNEKIKFFDLQISQLGVELEGVKAKIAQMKKGDEKDDGTKN